MAAILSHKTRLLLEADLLQAQSKTVQRLSSDIHFAAKILDFKVYDIESRITSLRKAAWEAKSQLGCDGETVVDGQNSRAGCSLKGALQNASTFLKTAQQVQTELKALTDVVCGRQEVVETGDPSKGRAEEGNAAIEAEKVKALKLESPSLGTLTKELTCAKQVFVESSRFIPVNFRAVSSKTSNAEMAESDKGGRPEHVKGAPFTYKDTTAPGKLVSAANGNHRRRGDHQTRARKFSRFSHVELPGRRDVDNRSRSPAGCRKPEKQQGEGNLLGWIPKKVGIARLPMDEDLRALMMHELQRKKRGRA